mgnify:CR=1 FL=1
MKIRSITLIGCYWHQRSMGNSYTSTAILLNGEHHHNTPVTYGYGNFCFQRADEWLLGKDIGSGGRLADWCEVQKPRVSLYLAKFYVPTEKELDRFAEGHGQRVSINA